MDSSITLTDVEIGPVENGHGQIVGATGGEIADLCSRGLVAFLPAAALASVQDATSRCSSRRDLLVAEEFTCA